MYISFRKQTVAELKTNIFSGCLQGCINAMATTQILHLYSAVEQSLFS